MCYREEEWHRLLDGRRVLIAGYGREGRSSERWLKRLMPDAVIDVADGNDNIRRVANSYDVILKSPGIPMSVFDGVDGCVEITQQSDLFMRVYADRMVGITGTKGKSTTTELIYRLLRLLVDGERRVIKAGNMGIPLFDIVEQIEADSIVVAELSCHQLEGVRRAPHVAVLLNFYQEHLDHYRSYEDYKLAKLNIALRQQEGDVFYYCFENAELRKMIEEYRSQIVSDIRAYVCDESKFYKLSPSLVGEHNRSNVSVALKVARFFGVDVGEEYKVWLDEVRDDGSIGRGMWIEKYSIRGGERVKELLRSFEGLPYRLQHVGRYDDIDFYDDSISTIPAATIAAVNALQRVDTLIVGGFDRGIEYGDLASFLAASAISNIAFVGEAGRRVHDLYRQAMEGRKDERHLLVEDDYGLIVPWCYRVTRSEHICLLSPAASSYDAFKNFEERGRCFDSLVHAIGFRHEMHRGAILSGAEQSTAELIERRIADLQPSYLYRDPEINAVLAFWGDRSKPCVAFRADIDALPIEESADLRYASCSKGVSHKCGHDGHSAMLLRFAQLIAEQGLQQVLLIFQPAEEVGLGARQIIDRGLLRQFDISYIFGVHNLPGYALGQMVAVRGTFAAASVGVKYKIYGRQTHASTPEQGINPGLAVADIVRCVAELNRGTDADGELFRQTTLVGISLGDEAYGTSAGYAEVMLTLRAFTNAAMAQLIADADAVVDRACKDSSISTDAAMGWEKEEHDPFVATENNDEVVDGLVALAEAERCSCVVRGCPFRWSEDFGVYLQHYRGAMFGIGAGERHVELHHPLYDFPDEIIDSTARLYCKILCTFATTNDR